MPPVLPPLLLLAAGKSERTTEPKGLFQFRKRFWIEHQLSAFAQAGGTRAIVVLGFHAETFRAACRWLDRGAFEGVAIDTRLNLAPDRGPFSSLQTALGDEACFVLPIDVPAAAPAVWQRLAEALGEHAVAQPIHGSRGGHPILLSKAFVNVLRLLPPSARLDHALANLATEQRARVVVEDGRVLENLNTPEAWRHFFETAAQADRPTSLER